MQPIIQVDIYGTTSGEEDEDHQGPGGFAAIINTGGGDLRIAGGDPKTDTQDMTMRAAARALSAVTWASDVTNPRIELRTNFEYMVTLFNTPGRRSGCKLPVWREILQEAALLDVRFIYTKNLSPE